MRSASDMAAAINAVVQRERVVCGFPLGMIRRSTVKHVGVVAPARLPLALRYSSRTPLLDDVLRVEYALSQIIFWQHSNVKPISLRTERQLALYIDDKYRAIADAAVDN